MNLPGIDQPRDLRLTEPPQLFGDAGSEELCKVLRQHFSPRQIQILMLMMQGQSRSKIATQLNLSVRTVDSVRTRLMVKLNAKTNSDLALKAFALLQGCS
ncbi:MAG: helix-turn-helix transcriptional regulator [Limnobacter sp.]|nr:helix-turn-helix transcriptional regulator [Limnobacter sp.]